MIKETNIHIIEYLMSLQRIWQYKADADDWHTPYQMEMCRQEMHRKLFDNVILPMLKLCDGFTDDDAYIRSKELFGNLDKIWAIYDATPFSLEEDEQVQWMAVYLSKFLYSTEVLYYLEGKTKYVHGVIKKEA
ncbi:MAG: hypothetical protein IJP44_10275 [Bacteroidales bacterium]|nr:hypothetical protein [Bacteroidales bacterium]